MSPSTRSARTLVCLPLLFALVVSGAAAAAQPSYEEAWKQARREMDRGETAKAAATIDQALARAGNSNDEWVWALRVSRADIFFLTNRFEEAAKILSQPLPPSVRNSATGARHLLAQVLVGYWRGERRTDLLEKARQTALKYAPHVLPEVLRQTNDEATLREAVRLARTSVRDERLALKTEAALVRIYAVNGKLAEAAQLAEALRPRLKQHELFRAAKSNVGNLGWIYSELGDYDQAVELLSAALADAVRMQDSNEQFTFLSTLSNVHNTRGDWESAVKACRRVIDGTVNQKHRSRGHAFSSIARAYLELGRVAEARSAVRQALALEGPEDALITRIGEARIDIATGGHAAAEKTLTAVIAQAKEAATKLEAEGQLAQVYALTGRHAQAVQAFERAVGLVRQARESVRRPEFRLTVYNNASELFDNYIDFLTGSGRREDALRVTETSRAQTLAEGLELAFQAKLDPRQIARQRNATILCYWLGRRRSYVWTVTPSGVQLTTIPKSDIAIEREVEAYRRRLVTTDGTIERSRAHGQQLYDTLVPPAVRSLARGSRVIIVPDGRLHLLNFETLIVPAKEPRYWIEDAVLSNASSLQLLTRSLPKLGGTPRMLLVGNPEKAHDAFPPLLKAGDEIARVQKHFGSNAAVLRGPRATPADYMAASPQSFEFVHFVAHGVAARTRPLDQSAVILGKDKTGEYRLIAREIAGRPINAHLVTISSCYGAGEATYAGEGLVGLAWAFLYAGAQQVVAALWTVPDNAAPRLMDEMYAGIRRGKDPALALRDAKLVLLRSGTSNKHAKFWAPFVVYV